MPYEPTTRNIVRFILVLTRAYPLKTDLHRFLVSGKTSISFLKLQSTLVNKCRLIVLQRVFVTPRHKIIVVYFEFNAQLTQSYHFVFVFNQHHGLPKNSFFDLS